MDEALAQFATALFIGALEGGPSYSAAINSYEAQYARYLQLAEDLDQPIGLPVSDYTGTAYFSIVYQKGPLFRRAGRDVRAHRSSLQATSPPTANDIAGGRFAGYFEQSLTQICRDLRRVAISVG